MENNVIVLGSEKIVPWEMVDTLRISVTYKGIFYVL